MLRRFITIGLLATFVSGEDVGQDVGDDVSICANLNAQVSIPEVGSTLPPRAEVSFSEANGACEARVVFHKLGSQQKIATQWHPVTSDISVFRLSPGLSYNVTVSVRAVDDTGSEERGILETAVLMPETAWPWLTGRRLQDPGFVTSMTGTPTWDLFTLDVHAYDAEPSFSGFVTIDSDGDVVWLWNVTSPSGTPDLGNFAAHVIDQLPDFSFAVQTMVDDNPLEIVSPGGSIINSFSFEPTCGIITHEGRLNADKTAVLSIAETWFEAAGLDLPQIGNQVVEWDFSNTGDLRVLYDISDFFNASTERGYGSTGIFTSTCNGTTAEVVDDWTHMNSVSVSAFDGSLIVNVRSFSTVCSFLYPEPSPPPPPLTKGGGPSSSSSSRSSGLQWCVSSELPDRSNFTFLNESDLFFQEHAVLQLENGNLLLYDNGNARVEAGYAGGGDSSRGVEYALDFEAMTISKVWEYSTIYDSHQGSNSPLILGGSNGNDGDHRLILVPLSGGDMARKERAAQVKAGTFVYGGERPFGTSVAIEVDAAGAEVATVLTNVFSDTPYRGVPFTTIAGEGPV